MASKSGDWYKALRESNPESYRNLMDHKYARRVEQLNSEPDKFAQMKFTKQRAGAKDRGLAWELSQDHVHKMIKETNIVQFQGDLWFLRSIMLTGQVLIELIRQKDTLLIMFMSPAKLSTRLEEKCPLQTLLKCVKM
jgi:hypothetical protein